MSALLLDEGLLDGMEFVTAAETFQGRHLFSHNGIGREDTAARCLALHEHQAGAALAQAAAVFGSVEADVVA